jgi:hypothetical protein
MELTTTREATTCQATHSFAAFMEPEGHCRIHKSSPPVPIMNQTSPVNDTPYSLSKIHPNIIHPPTYWSSYWFLSEGTR